MKERNRENKISYSITYMTHIVYSSHWHIKLAKFWCKINILQWTIPWSLSNMYRSLQPSVLSIIQTCISSELKNWQTDKQNTTIIQYKPTKFTFTKVIFQFFWCQTINQQTKKQTNILFNSVRIFLLYKPTSCFLYPTTAPNYRDEDNKGGTWEKALRQNPQRSTWKTKRNSRT